MSSLQAGPVEWNGKLVPLLDVLLLLRDYGAKNRSLLLFVGGHDVERFKAFEGGILAYRFLCGASDADFLAFQEWLRNRHALSSDGWQAKFLASAGGDHFAAIMAYLDECAHYCDTHRAC